MASASFQLVVSRDPGPTDRHVPPHIHVDLTADTSLGELFAELARRGFPPPPPGRTVWVCGTLATLEAAGEAEGLARPLALWASKWPEPAYVEPPQMDVAACFAAGQPKALHFQCLSPAEPADVLARALTGRPLHGAPRPVPSEPPSLWSRVRRWLGG